MRKTLSEKKISQFSLVTWDYGRAKFGILLATKIDSVNGLKKFVAFVMKETIISGTINF